MQCVFTFVFVICTYKLVIADFYSAITDMEQLVETERETIKTIGNYINNERQRIEGLEILLKRMKKKHKEARDENYVLNPINSFKLIKRLTVDLEMMERIIKYTTAYTRDDTVQYPNEDDLVGAIEGLARLQRAYQLKVSDLSGGLITGNYSQIGKPFTEKVSPMTANDCYELGRNLYELYKNEEAVEWLMQALKKKNQGFVAEEDVLYAISMAYRAMDDNYNTTLWTNRLFASLESYSDMVNMYQKLLLEETEEKQVEEDSGIKKCTDNLVKSAYDFSELCRGANYVPKKISMNLKCRYVVENHPFLKLAPIKMEELYLEPEVYVYHDVITDYEIEFFKSVGKPMLDRARVLVGGVIYKPSNIRITKTAFIPDFESEVTERLSQRVEDFTGLSMEAAEDFQIANYGVGGYYPPHYDYFSNSAPSELLDAGNRYSTVLFYLSDVALGGATVFTNLGLPVFPKKGAALYFKNLLHTASGDPASAHGACPLLIGDKWVLTKWIRQYGQELRQPCKKSIN